ncbi:amino acid adenylation domain-containing protein [Kitasatospora sp. NPDC096147]|uniref:amino acid adenylation domain-containing protein n=1 Tax=Kitasatospora sp. NPDC096147 TaxID=3364093 RepID=UPI0037FFEA5C
MTTFANLPATDHADGPSGVPIGSRTPAAAIAALALVVHRAGLRDTLRVDYLDPAAEPTRAGVLTLDLSDTPTAGELAERLTAAVAGLDEYEEELLDELEAAATDFGYRGAGSPETGRRTTPLLLTAPDGSVHLLPKPVDAVTEHRLAGLVELALAATPGDALTAVPLASAEDLAQVTAWGGTGVAPGPARPVHVLVAERAQAAPDAVAVSADGSKLTYRELDGAADAVAAALLAAGVRPGEVVGVSHERGAALVTAVLGVLKAGGAYLALDPEAPDARSAAQLADAGVRTVLAQDSLRQRLPGGLTVLTPAEVPAEAPAGFRPVEVGPDDLAYISYTSGSTGEPKGVAVPHRAVARLVGPNDWSDLRPEDVVLQLAPVAFDASTLELWGALANGASLAVYPAGPVTADRLAELLRDEGVTVAWLTAGLFHQMVGSQLKSFAGLRQVIAGGDVIRPDQLRRLLGAHPELTFTNGYGPTENTTFTACWTTRTAPRTGSVPIGRPIAGTRVLVLDSALRPVPAGVPGELYAAGEGLAREYLGRPEATAAAFREDPARPGERIYRTGDLARWLPDGDLEFLGRADNQVKINGYRVEIGAVEAAVLANPAVAEAVVLAQPDPAGGKRLLAYLVPTGDGDVASLREALRRQLPSYMLPWAYVTLEKFPLNRNGKLDRAALPAARRVPRDLPDAYRAPVTPEEEYLCGLWGEVLDVEPVGIDDDFFELGGHSLMAGELITRIQEERSIELSAQTLYLRPTIAELAEALEQGTASA